MLVFWKQMNNSYALRNWTSTFEIFFYILHLFPSHLTSPDSLKHLRPPKAYLPSIFFSCEKEAHILSFAFIGLHCLHSEWQKQNSAPPHTHTATSFPKFPLRYGLKRQRHYVTIQHYRLCCASMELCENCFCMFSTNLIVFCTEWFYSTAHCLQEKPHQSHGTAGEIWGFNPSYNRGRKVFQLLSKHSFSYTFLFLSPILCPLHSSYLSEEAPKAHRAEE